MKYIRAIFGTALLTFVLPWIVVPHIKEIYKELLKNE